MNWKLPLILSAIFVVLVVVIIFIPGISLNNKFSLCITLALVVVTAYYAIQTGKNVTAITGQTNKTIKAMQEQTEEMRKQNNLLVEQIRKQNRPNIRIEFKKGEPSNSIYMHIENVGREYAKNIKCIPDPDFEVNGVKLSMIINRQLPPVLFGGKEHKIRIGPGREVTKGRELKVLADPKIAEYVNLSEEEKQSIEEFSITCIYTEENGKCCEVKIPSYIPKGGSI